MLLTSRFAAAPDLGWCIVADMDPAVAGLYRPTGVTELGLVYDADMRAFPRRLREQPIFYPVTNFGYAATIAREWNTKHDAGIGYVTRFGVEAAYASQFEKRIVGGREHEELWVPADQLVEFNRHIVGAIRVTAAFFASQPRGAVPTQFMLRGRTAEQQLVALDRLRDENVMDFHLEVAANHRVVWLNYPYWAVHHFDHSVIPEKRRAECVAAIREHWQPANPPLPVLDDQPREAEPDAS